MALMMSFDDIVLVRLHRLEQWGRVDVDVFPLNQYFSGVVEDECIFGVGAPQRVFVDYIPEGARSFYTVYQ